MPARIITFYIAFILSLVFGTFILFYSLIGYPSYHFFEILTIILLVVASTGLYSLATKWSYLSKFNKAVISLGITLSMCWFLIVVWFFIKLLNNFPRPD